MVQMAKWRHPNVALEFRCDLPSLYLDGRTKLRDLKYSRFAGDLKMVCRSREGIEDSRLGARESEREDRRPRAAQARADRPCLASRFGHLKQMRKGASGIRLVEAVVHAERDRFEVAGQEPHCQT